MTEESATAKNEERTGSDEKPSADSATEQAKTREAEMEESGEENAS